MQLNYDIRVLNPSDVPDFENLVAEIERKIVNPAWWLPIKENAKKHFFDSDWTTFIGCFHGDKLVGASALFWNEFEYGESVSAIGGCPAPIAEIGRCMVLNEHRGQNLMLKMNSELLKIARKRGVKSVIATAHPDNLPSNSSLIRLGLKIQKCIIKDGSYPRNVLLMSL